MNNKQLLLTANEQISIGNYEGFLNYCTPDTRWEFLGDQTLQGKAEVSAYMKSAYLKPPKVSVDQAIEEGDFLVVYGTIELIDAEGNWKSYHYCDVWLIAEGKLATLKAYVVPQ